MSVPDMDSISDLLNALWPQDTWSRVDGILQNWRERLDSKDNYSGHHAGLASEYAIELAHRQDLGFDTIAALWIAGHVYDLGKISVPENILVKTGPLSTAELLMMRKHVDTGYDILRDWDVLRVSPRWMSQTVLDVVLGHHERWDGAGYPSGQSGAAIPVVARIMSIADAFAAMIMDAPYRPARAQELALHEIEQNSGAQFDPYLVKSFTSLVRVNALTGRGPNVQRVA